MKLQVEKVSEGREEDVERRRGREENEKERNRVRKEKGGTLEEFTHMRTREREAGYF